MTIDWTQAPPWARYAAMDADGFWAWYEARPSQRTDQWIPGCGRFEFFKPIPTNWRTTLTERPTE